MSTPADTRALLRETAVPALTAVIVLALGHTLIDLYATTITPLLPRFTDLWHLTSTSLGFLAAATSLTGSLLQPLLGFYLDKRGTSALAALSVLWMAATMLLLGWLPSFAALFALATVTVLGSAVYHPLGAALTRRVSPSNRRGLYMSLFMNIGNLGWATAPLLVTWYVSLFGLRPLGWLALPGLVEAAVLVALGLSLARPATTPAAGRGDQVPPGVSAATLLQPPLASRAVRLRGVIFLVAATTLRSWVGVGIQTYLPVYLVHQGHRLTFAGSAMTTFILAGTVAGFLVGYLSDRLDRRNLYAASLVLAGAAFWWFLSAPAAWAGPAIALSGVFLYGSVPLTVVLVQEMLPNHAGTGSGLIMGFAGGVGGLMVLASGVLADRLGLVTALRWLVPALPVAALCALAIPKASCRQPLRTKRSAAGDGNEAGV
jgi:FSR family fosmidomycin resistance protein-like MFS transporter